eukprot:m51a1_g11289 hypothetical protein (269) ;mRNA; f:42724-43925
MEQAPAQKRRLSPDDPGPSTQAYAALETPVLVRSIFSFLSVAELRNVRLVCRLWRDVVGCAELYEEMEERTGVVSLLGTWEGHGPAEGYVFDLKFVLRVAKTPKPNSGLLPVEEGQRILAYALGKMEVEWVRGTLNPATRELAFAGHCRSCILGCLDGREPRGEYGELRCDEADCTCAQYTTSSCIESAKSCCVMCGHSWRSHAKVGASSVPPTHSIACDAYVMKLPARFAKDSVCLGKSRGCDSGWANVFACRRDIPFDRSRAPWSW